MMYVSSGSLQSGKMSVKITMGKQTIRERKVIPVESILSK